MSNDGDDELERRLRDVLSSRGLGVPVPPDAINRIHAGARRRQQRRSVASALGAVVIIAIAATAIGVRSYDHGSTVTADNHTASPSPALSSGSAAAVSPSAELASTTSTPSNGASPVVVEPTASGIALSPPTEMFNPVSVSAISVNDYWVLGYTQSGVSTTTTVLRTTDGGKTFSSVGSPNAIIGTISRGPPGTESKVISDIRFGDTTNGWVYGNHLFETANGGVSWSPVTGVPGNVVDLAAASGNVWAVADNEVSGSPSYSLFHATYGAGGTSAWAKVTLSTSSFANVVVIKKAAYLLASTTPTQPGILVTITNGGAAVSSTSGPCTAQTGGVLSVAGDGSLWALCSTGHSSTEFVSADRGLHWAPSQFPSVTYSIGGIDSTHAVVFDDRELDMITLTTSSPVPSAPGSIAAPSIGFIGFTTTKVGFLIASMQNVTPDQLWRTTDGGQTWSAVAF